MVSTIRRGFGLNAFVVLVLVTLATPAAASPAAACDNWSQFRFGPGRSGFNPFERTLTVSNVSKLRERPPFSAAAPMQSAPAVVHGVAYVFAINGRLYAFRVSDGTRLWDRRVGAPKPQGSGEEFGTSSPAVSHGRVFIGTHDGKVVAVHASDGHVLWSRSPGARIKSSPAVAGGVVFIGSVNHSVYAFRASDGKRLWRFVTGGIILSSPAVVGGTVYIGSADHNVYALRARDGAKRWARRTGGPVYAIPSVVGRSLYVTSQDSKLYALDASTGAVRWTAMYNDYPISSVTLDGRSPAVADGRVFTTGFDTSVRAFSASNGHKVWRLDLWRIDLFQSLADPAVANGVVYFGASEDRLLAFKASSGKLLFSGRTAQLGLAYFSAAVTDGKVIMGSNDGKLHVFHLPSGAGRHQPTYSTSHNPQHHRGLTG